MLASNGVGINLLTSGLMNPSSLALAIDICATTFVKQLILSGCVIEIMLLSINVSIMRCESTNTSELWFSLLASW